MGIEWSMPVSPEAKARLLSALGAARPITSRAMFGGLGLYHDGVFMGVVDDDRLYLKIDDQTEPSYIERGMEGWSPDPSPKGFAYRELPADVLEDPALCGEWLDAARDAAVRRKAKPKQR